MKTDVVTVDVSDTVATAARRMSERNLGAVVVVNDGRLWGMFTERDLLNRVVAAGRDPGATAVSEVTTTSCTTVDGSTEVMECYRILRDKPFRHLPIVDDDNRPVGMIAARDFLRTFVVQMEAFADMTEFEAQVGSLALSGEPATLR
jgi:CBS domain-containing protein